MWKLNVVDGRWRSALRCGSFLLLLVWWILLTCFYVLIDGGQHTGPMPPTATLMNPQTQPASSSNPHQPAPSAPSGNTNKHTDWSLSDSQHMCTSWKKEFSWSILSALNWDSSWYKSLIIQLCSAEKTRHVLSRLHHMWKLLLLLLSFEFQFSF